MTTTVKVEAHCSSNKEVVIEVNDGEDTGHGDVIQDGETREVYAYDSRRITVYERTKNATA